MIKLDNAEGLTKAAAVLNKAVGGLHSHFKAAAAHHDGLHKAHTEYAAHLKAKHDAMPDDHEDKAHMSKAHEFHTQKAAMHKAHSDHNASMAKEFADDGASKGAETTNVAAVVSTNTGAGVDGLIKETTTGLVKKSLEMLQTDPTVQDEIRKMVLEGVKSALGGQIQPTAVAAVTPNNPFPGLTLVPRGGANQPPTPSPDDLAKAAASMDPELVGMLG